MTKPVKYTSWKALAAGCKKWDAASAAGRIDESKPIPCGLAADFDPGDDRPAFIGDLGKGRVEVTFPGHSEAITVWRLHWSGGAAPVCDRLRGAGVRARLAHGRRGAVDGASPSCMPTSLSRQQFGRTARARGLHSIADLAPGANC